MLALGACQSAPGPTTAPTRSSSNLIRTLLSVLSGRASTKPGRSDSMPVFHNMVKNGSFKRSSFMKTIRILLGALLAAIFSLDGPTQLHAQGTAFTYQGRLNDGAAPANGSYDLTFALFDVPSGGSALAGPLTNSATAVSNGLFTVTLDLGANFPGTDRWLQIAVRTNGAGAFATLLPRQMLTPSPYA